MDLRVNRDGELPLGTQLTWKLRSAIASGELRAGARLPSVRGAAAAAGVNVNTVRAVYGRLEREGLVSERAGQGHVRVGERSRRARGRAARDPRRRRPGRRRLTDARGGPGAPRPTRADRRARGRARPPPATPQRGPTDPQPSTGGGALLSAAELTAVRDGLQERLDELNAARAEVLRRLDELPATERTEAAGPRRPSTSTPSLAGARVRWVGA